MTIDKTEEDRWGLRRRIVASTALVSTLVVLALALTTYVVVRSYLVGQRDAVVQREAFANARVVSSLLPVQEGDPTAVLGSLRSEPGSIVLVRSDGEWLSSSIGVGPESLPAELLQALDDGDVATMRFSGDGGPRTAVVVPLAAEDLDYIEVFPLDGLENALNALRATLVVAALVMAGAGAALGAWATRRALSPLVATGLAAQRLAAGDLTARLESPDDPDLRPFVVAFNEMADSLTERIEQEGRFASDVSHELRTPVATIRAATDVLVRRRDELGDRGREALDLLSEEVDEFDRLVTDLLEISRLEATEPERMTGADHVDLADLVSRLARQHCATAPPVIVVPEGASTVVVTHRLRVERILGNLLKNSEVHGVGCRAVTVVIEAQSVRVAVDDEGPGVPIVDRTRVFERFARGDDARQRPGSGLGLAIAHEHARHLGATLLVGDAPGSGARFTLVLPRQVMS
jgi:two-component system sensor histidine kinase MtrB